MCATKSLIIITFVHISPYPYTYLYRICTNKNKIYFIYTCIMRYEYKYFTTVKSLSKYKKNFDFYLFYKFINYSILQYIFYCNIYKYIF